MQQLKIADALINNSFHFIEDTTLSIFHSDEGFWPSLVKGASPPPMHIFWVVAKDHISETIGATSMKQAL